ncbi:MAG TPA: ABC transporter permease [Kineosporiaceae bacterium]
MSTPTLPDVTTRRAPALGGFNLTLVRLELRRLLRNRRTVIFTLVMPIVFFLMFGLNAQYADRSAGHGNWSASIMVSMAAYGAMLGTTSSGASVAVERSLGWSRQLRLTPLNPAAYIVVKLLLALAVGLTSILAVYVAGLVSHKPSMPVSLWIVTALLAWAGSLVFAAFGLFMGYLLPSENVMQILGPVLAILAFLGGLFIPLDEGSVLATIAQFTPMYGLNGLVHAPLTTAPFKVTWVVNLVTWLLLFSTGAVWRFRRDTARV